MELRTGWNLIAAPTTTTINVATAIKGVTYDSIVVPSSLRGIVNPEAISYNPATTLQAGNAYFLKVSSQQTWNIPKQENKTTYVYDGDGGRVKSTVHSQQSIETTYIGSSYELVTRNSELVTKKHIFLGSTRICSVDCGLSTVDYHYFHTDHIGSSNIVTDKDGNLAKLLEYSPYGLTSREEGSYNTDCKFTGKLFDTSTALYYYGARYYDPELGRFIQPDTIVPYPDDPQSFNRYSYARNNPIRYVDPTGHSFIDSIQKLIGKLNEVIDKCISWLEKVTGSGWEFNVDVSYTYQWGETQPVTTNDDVYEYACSYPPYACDRTYFVGGIGNPLDSDPEYAHALAEELGGRVGNFIIWTAYKNSKGSKNIIEDILDVAREQLNINAYSSQLARRILSDLKTKPLEKGDKINLIGYSGGAQIVLNAADKLGGRYKISNAILIGASINELTFSHIDKVSFIGGKLDMISGANVRAMYHDKIYTYKVEGGHCDYFKPKYINNTANLIADIINSK
jgi:RHS repeat-associated protein